MRHANSLFVLLLLLLLAGSTQAQDVILQTTGQELPARVLTIEPEQISYVLLAAPTDTLRMRRADVFLIRYANGTREVLNPMATAGPASLTPAQARLLGQQDARKNFKAPAAFWGTLGTTIVSMPIGFAGGLATGAAFALTPPKRHNIIASDQALLQNPDYVKGYQKQAQRKKLGSAAAGLGVGTALSVAALAVVFSMVFYAH
ncbi:hypothetical protein [Hymenobacter persicinus]|uniref:DUF456 domain-containing protein n=1 Tax=Hymenobacter persicinus TaxID=2025506 RepID=A0A4Q5LB11_9BACT|nr:hypothetical protein [Hymenobacter persicinus]RYU78364.1 hypothetical protein EWM57_14430 [Hymenobacter persicinus]